MPKSSSDQPGCLLAIFKLLNISPPSGDDEAEPLPYRLRDDFLSAAELSFYRVLVQVVAGKAVICPKVRVGDRAGEQFWGCSNYPRCKEVVAAKD